MSSLLVSYVIPARNEGKLLNTTLEHIHRISASYSYEIIVVDDASDDPITLPTDGRNSRVSLIRNPSRKGVAVSRRVGCEAASGQFIFNIDAHVCFSRDIIANLLRAQEQHPAAILGVSLAYTNDFSFFHSCASAAVFDPEDLPRSFGWKVDLTPLPWIVPRVGASTERVERAPIAGAASLWIASNTYRSLGGFWPGLCGFGNVEDTELCLTAWALGYEVRIVTGATCLHYSAGAPKTIPPGHEHGKYDGNALNAARVARLHLPLRTFVQSGYRPEDLAFLPSSDFDERARFIEARRKRSRQIVLSLITESASTQNLVPFPSRLLLTDRCDGAKDYAEYDTILCISSVAYDEFCDRAKPAHLLTSSEHFREGLEELHRYYRPELWARSYRMNLPTDLHRELGASGKQHLEDIMLQHLSPLWYFEDLLQEYLSRERGAVVDLDLQDPTLAFHLRKILSEPTPCLLDDEAGQ